MSQSYRPRIYVGRLSHRARESDVERFFRGYGKVSDVMLKNGFGFVEFEDLRDAEDAVHDLNGRDLCGERVLLEIAKGTPRGAGGAFVSGYYPPPQYRSNNYQSNSRGSRDYGGGGGRDFGGGGGGYNRQERGYRLIVENLSSRVSWQDLKDLFRPYGEVMFADAHHYRKNEGVVEFSSKSDLRRAAEKLDQKEINGRKIHLIPDLPKTVSRSRSRSYSPERQRERSLSYSPERKIKRSRSRSPSVENYSRRRSASPPKKRHSSSFDKRDEYDGQQSRSPTPLDRNGSAERD